MYRLFRYRTVLGAVALAIIYLLPLPNVLAFHHMQEMILPFGLGMLVYKKKDIISAFAQDHKLLWVPAGIVLLTTPLYVSFVYVHRLGYGLPFVISGLVEVIVSTAFCYLCKYILHWVVGLRKFFMVLGKYSLEIYCIHMMFVKYLSIKVPTVVFNIPVVVDFLYCLIALLIALLCVGISYLVLNRIPVYRWIMLGQWKQNRKE